MSSSASPRFELPGDDARLEELQALRPLPYFAPSAMQFVAQFAEKLLTRKDAAATAPELVALGYWFRPSRIAKLQQESSPAERASRRVARGLAFHIVPSNVDVLFCYSWLLSVLAGNLNVVRLPQKRGPASEILLQHIDELLAEPRFRELKERTLFLSYGHEESITRRLSLACQLRVVWGGDDTVEMIRQIPLNPLAAELRFADRFSLAAMSARKVASLEEAALARLVQDLAKDIFTFDQRACSSVRAVCWVGEPDDCRRASERLWAAFERTAPRIGWRLPAGAAGERLSQAMLVAAGATNSEVRLCAEGRICKVRVDALADSLRQASCGAGMLLESHCPDLRALAAQLTSRDQTLALFGFEASEVDSLVGSLGCRAVDRIVPVGNALDFHHVWEGWNLLHEFSREVVISL